MTTGNTPMTGGQIVKAGLAVAGSVAALLPPNIGLAITIADQLYNAAMLALHSGKDLGDDELEAALDADNAEKLLDDAAEARAREREAAAATAGAAGTDPAGKPGG